MFQDFKDLLSNLNASKVKYLIVGGYAVGFHAQPRVTKDLDLLVKPDAANASALHKALTAFGAPVADITPADLIERGKFFRFGRPPIAVDILPEIDGVEFNAAWKPRVSMKIDESLSVYVISDADLIAGKIAAGRPQDLADVDALRRASQARNVAPPAKRSAPKKRPGKKRGQ